MADKVVYNRYRNTSPIVQVFMTLDGSVKMYPGGTAVAREGSTVAKSRDTVIVQRKVELPNYEDQEDTDWEEQQEETQVPQHENTNLTNTDPALDERTILTDAFDGSGGTGAVNNAAAPEVTHEEPETPKPTARSKTRGK